MTNVPVDRRSLLRLGAGSAAIAGAGITLPLLRPRDGNAGSSGDPNQPPHQHSQDHAHPDLAHSMSSTVGDVDVVRMGFDPTDVLTTFNYGDTTTMQDGTVVREWGIVAIDKEIEIAPGLFFPAWTYNGQVPGPTLRCNEGERLRITFVNNGSHPHTLHFHGIHAATQDGVPGVGPGEIEPGRTVDY